MITIYATQDCSWCRQVEKFFEYNQQDYEKVFIDDEPEIRQYLYNVTGSMTVPISTNGEKFAVGYNIPTLKKLMEK